MSYVGGVVPISDRGWFGYHYVSLEPTMKARRVSVFDRVRVREVWDEDDEGHPVLISEEPDWRYGKECWPVMQYVICDGEGGIVSRIPIRGSRRAQMRVAWKRLMAHMTDSA